MRVPFSHDTICWPEKRWITDVPKYFHLFAVSVEKKMIGRSYETYWSSCFLKTIVSFLNIGEISLFSKNLGMFF